MERKNFLRLIVTSGYGGHISPYSKEYIRVEKRKYKNLIDIEKKICSGCPDKETVGCNNCTHAKRLENLDKKLATIMELAAWYDQETPGDSGSLLHLAFLDDDNSDFYYRTVDIETGTLGTLRTINSSVSVDGNPTRNLVGLTQTVSGNLIAVVSTQTEHWGFKSDDSGATWDAITSPFETATEED